METAILAAKGKETKPFPFQVHLPPHHARGHADKKVATLGGQLVTVVGATKTAAGNILYLIRAPFGTFKIRKDHTRSGFSSPPTLDINQLPLDS